MDFEFYMSLNYIEKLLKRNGVGIRSMVPERLDLLTHPTLFKTGYQPGSAGILPALKLLGPGKSNSNDIYYR